MAELCKSCVHTKVCMKAKNLVGDIFIPGNPMFFDNEELYKKYEERKKAGFPCDDFMPADVAPVRHGRWVTKEYMYGDPDVGIEDMWVDRLAEQSDYFAYCSICGKDAGYTGEGELVLSDFCPTCGAAMREVDNEPDS